MGNKNMWMQCWGTRMDGKRRFSACCAPFYKWEHLDPGKTTQTAGSRWGHGPQGCCPSTQSSTPHTHLPQIRWPVCHGAFVMGTARPVTAFRARLSWLFHVSCLLTDVVKRDEMVVESVWVNKCPLRHFWRHYSLEDHPYPAIFSSDHYH